jgi:hypothetical protein
MRFRAILTLVALFIVTVFVACLCVAISSDALASQPHSNLFKSKEASERGSVSGKISAIGDASFSVDVKKSQDLVTLQFLIDDTTKVEGRLDVGLSNRRRKQHCSPRSRAADEHNAITGAFSPGGFATLTNPKQSSLLPKGKVCDAHDPETHFAAHY